MLAASMARAWSLSVTARATTYQKPITASTAMIGLASAR